MVAKKTKEVKMPKTIGACVDLAYRLRAERQAAQKIVDEIKKQEQQVLNHLIEEIPASDAKGVVGKTAKAVINTELVPTAKDWDEVYKWISKKKRFDLLQKRLSAPAFRELWEDGKSVPGVEQYLAKKVSLTKA